MPKLIISGAVIESFHKHKEGSGCYTRLLIKSEVSTGLKDHLKIQDNELPDKVSSFPFIKDCALSAQSIEFEPNDKKWRKDFRMEFGGDRVGDFKIERVKNETGNGSKLQASFNVRTRTPGACAVLEPYFEVAAGSDGQLTITYGEQKKIPEVDGAAMAETARQAGRRARKEERAN